MRRRMLATLALWAALAPPAAQAASGLTERLDAALAGRALRGARVAALVVSRQDGRVLYAREPDRALVPASNQKILTALAALSALGPTHRFTTHLYADAAPDAEGAIGVLAVHGGGDPALTSEELWRLGAELRRTGVRRIREGLLLDASDFDAERWHPAWGPVSARAYHAPVGALAANYGAFSVTVEAGDAAGAPVRVRVEPPIDYLRLASRARTGPRQARLEIAVDRSAGAGFEQVIVSGVAPVGAPAKTYYRSVLDPVRYAGAVIRLQLEANGIEVGGATRLGPVSEDAVPLLAFQGKKLAEIVQLFLKYSNNAIGESLVKALGARQGAPGSWPGGMAALRAELAGLGLSSEGWSAVDGSGLSYENRVSPRTLVSALRLAHDSFRFGPEFEAALPIAAADGTLEERAEAAALAVRAKTGLLTRVTGLSGYARQADGRDVVFSILVNGFRVPAESAMDAVDGFVAALVRDGTPPADQDLESRGARRGVSE